MTQILPDHLDPTLHDDTAARIDVAWCDRCGEQLDAQNECEYVGVNPDRPACAGCCECEDHASDRCSAQHTPGTGTWYAA